MTKMELLNGKAREKDVREINPIILFLIILYLFLSAILVFFTGSFSLIVVCSITLISIFYVFIKNL